LHTAGDGLCIADAVGRETAETRPQVSESSAAGLVARLGCRLSGILRDCFSPGRRRQRMFDVPKFCLKYVLLQVVLSLSCSTSRRNPESLRRALTLPRPRWKHRHTRRQWQTNRNPTMSLSRLRVPTHLVATSFRGKVLRKPKATRSTKTPAITTTTTMRKGPELMGE